METVCIIWPLRQPESPASCRWGLNKHCVTLLPLAAQRWDCADCQNADGLVRLKLQKKNIETCGNSEPLQFELLCWQLSRWGRESSEIRIVHFLPGHSISLYIRVERQSRKRSFRYLFAIKVRTFNKKYSYSTEAIWGFWSSMDLPIRASGNPHDDRSFTHLIWVAIAETNPGLVR